MNNELQKLIYIGSRPDLRPIEKLLMNGDWKITSITPQSSGGGFLILLDKIINFNK